MIKNILLTIVFGLFVNVCAAQLLFVDEQQFLDLKTNYTPLPEGLTIDSTSVLNGDTLAYIVTLPDGNALVKGQYLVSRRKKVLKVGVWQFYYSNGNIQTIRKYDSKGALINVEALLDMNGDSLSIGFPYKNSDKTYYGHMYHYDQSGNVDKVVRYSQGFIVDSFKHDKYDTKRLKIPALREYQISETSVLTEYHFEEAVELLNTDPKPLFIRATQSYSGFSRGMEKNIFSDPDIAKRIKDNFHLVYLDLGQQTSISFEHKGETVTFDPDPANNNKVHKIVKEFFGVDINNTPTFIVLDADLSLISTSTGTTAKKEEFIYHLNYYLDGHFHGMKYSDYNPGVNNKFKAIFR